jgi:nitronate monooxygenase
VATRLTELLRCELPIQLAPMGSVSVTPALPLAVTAAGGHAVYPALAMPQAALAAIVEALSAGGAGFGVNFLVPLMVRESVELAAERAPYVDFFLAEPDPQLVALVHAGGAACGWQVETADEARAAEAAGCDVLVAKGWESGGRKRLEGPALLPLLDAVLEAVAVPVVAAGGIATARGVAAGLAAGADGVRIGTRLIAATESDAHPAWQRAIVDAGAEESVVSMAFNAGMPVPGPHRVLRRSIEAAEALGGDDAGVVRMGGVELPVARFAPMPPTRDSTGAIEAMPFYAGQSVGAVTEIRPAAEIVRELAAGLPGAS